MPTLREFTDTANMTAALVQHVATHLEGDLARQEQAVLVVSGGRSPMPFFLALSAQPLPWSRVAVTLADERWVPPGHPDSNETLVRTHLLQGRAASARMVPFWTGEATPEAAVPMAAGALGTLPHPFSEVVLGMGEDGHMASLFPDAVELAEGLETKAAVLAVHPLHAPHARLSLSLHSLLASRDIALVISGPEKKAILERALQDGPVGELPLRAILRQTTVPVTIFWAPEPCPC